MSIFIKHYKVSRLVSAANSKLWRFSSTAADTNNDDEEFRVLDIVKSRQRTKRHTYKRADVQPDRTDRMSPEQNWGNVWPGPKTFHPSSVPLPLRQGYVPKGQAPPGKKANAELMKIPNFLHLTPPVIKAHCEAIKKFCTPWPELLNSDEAIEKHYPVEVITSDYCHASPSIRNPLARVANVRVSLAALPLDEHARDKLLRLVGDRHDPDTGYLTFVADRCPTRQQNLDYCHYLLTACYVEAWTHEDWETSKTEDDMELYNFDRNPSKRSLVDWHMRCSGQVEELTEDQYRSFDAESIEHGGEYKKAVSRVFNDGESDDTLREYGVAVRKLLGLPEKL